MLGILLISTTALIACSSTNIVPIHTIEWESIVPLPSGTTIIFPETQIISIGQTDFPVTQFTTDTSCVIFTMKYLKKIMKVSLEKFE